jgi:hypothetical protein
MLLEFDGKDVLPGPYTLSIKEFKKLWTRDKTRDKRIAKSELSYVYFMTDFKSPFSNITDDEDRSNAIINSLDLPKGWKPDATVKACIDIYKERQKTITMILLDDARYALNEISRFLRSINLHATDERGNFIYDVKKMADTIKMIPSLSDSLDVLEEKVKREIDVKKQLRGDKEKSVFEDGL